jgi:antitoxin component YwqK of YwqJK toxin-antitoxin module
MKYLIFMVGLLSFNLTAKVNPVTEYIESLDIEGDFIINNPIGFKVLEGTITDGFKDGEWRYYYPDSEQLWSIERYAKGKPVGVWTLYHKDGRIKLRDDLNDMKNNSFSRPSPACMGPASGFHSSACTGQIKSKSGSNKW